ncbi:hypothetical protein [Brachyspira pilosicoli]|uniref:Lipoprotein n=1 Tax=Brachyspira pilosicoli TaxID=52584 RepID=A0A5C8EE37_BRAPL|nr:hypothetical protein [Brachyspira pilosicoli]TXJ35261.1 hypothetical protein EPJ72_12470 [Brachyspira pilosicoli]
MNKKILLIITIVSSFLAISCGDKNTDPTITPLTKEEVAKFQGTWGSDNLSKVSGDAVATEVMTASFTINADGSIKDNDTQQTITLDKINKVSDNVFQFTSKGAGGRTIITLKHKVDFTDNNAPKDTLVWTREVFTTAENPAKSYSATYEGTLAKAQ